MSVINWPAVSSMTTNCGSFSLEARATRVAAGIPRAIAKPARRILTGKIHVNERKREITAQTSNVASEPQVPGPGLSRPAPKNVAITVAQSGAA